MALRIGPVPVCNVCDDPVTIVRRAKMRADKVVDRDSELVVACLGGHKRSFDDLCAKYHDYALKIAARLGSRSSEVEDIVQESYLRAYLGLGRLKSPNLFKSWLVGIVMNVAREFARARGKAMSLAGDVESSGNALLSGTGQDVAWGADPALVLEDRELKRLLVETVLELPISMRRPALLFYFEGWELRETAEMLGISAAAVRTRLSRARAALRETLRNRGMPR